MSKIRLKTKLSNNEITVKTIISHPMDTGRKKDAEGQIIPKHFIKNKLNLDDSLDVFAVHGVGGIIGTMLAGVLAAEQFGGLGLETSVGEQTYIQFVGVISVALYTLIATIIITSVVRAIFGLRIDGVEEDGDGVDVNTHGESGYNL